MNAVGDHCQQHQGCIGGEPKRIRSLAGSLGHFQSEIGDNSRHWQNPDMRGQAEEHFGHQAFRFHGYNTLSLNGRIIHGLAGLWLDR